MSGWILDTNILLELRKPDCDARVRAWVEGQPITALHVSCVTLADIRFGIERLEEGSWVRWTLTSWLDDTLRPWFEGRVLDIDEAVVLAWRRLVEAARARQQSCLQPDLFIAATAVTHGLGIATRNVADFAAADVPVLNPWDAD